jgi:diacylglycerol kinase family enzyme
MTLLAHTDPTAALQACAAVFLNNDAGSAARMGEAEAARRVADALARHGVTAELVATAGADLPRRLEERLHAGSAPAAVIAAGGDGTVQSAVQHLAGTGIPLGILPLGTRNHFARDLGLPLELGAAAAAIAAGNIRTVDLGEVNGRFFVNNASIGLYPAMVRDRVRHGRGRRLLALAISLISILRHPPARRLRIEAMGSERERRVPLAFVGNNLYALDLFALGRRSSLEGGELCLFTANWRGIPGFARLVLRAALGRLDQDADFERQCVPELIIHSRRERLGVSLDGEVMRLRPPLRFRIRPGALRVLGPAPAR